MRRYFPCIFPKMGNREEKGGKDSRLTDFTLIVRYFGIIFTVCAIDIFNTQFHAGIIVYRCSNSCLYLIY